MEQKYNVTVDRAVNYTRITAQQALELKKYWESLGYYVKTSISKKS